MAGTLQIQVLREWNETNLYFLHVFLLKCHSVMKQLLATLPQTAITSLWFTCLHSTLSQGKHERRDVNTVGYSNHSTWWSINNYQMNVFFFFWRGGYIYLVGKKQNKTKTKPFSHEGLDEAVKPKTTRSTFWSQLFLHVVLFSFPSSSPIYSLATPSEAVVWHAGRKGQ